MEDFIGYIIPALFVLFGVIPAIAKVLGKGKKPNQNTAAQQRKPASAEPFSDEMKRTPVTQSASAVRTDMSLTDEREREERLKRMRQKKEAQAKAARAQQAAAQKKAETHSHEGKSEAAYGEMGTEKYAGEGCEEHYNLRFIADELRASNETEISDEVAYLRSVIVLGEIINEPKYKSY